MAYFWIFIAGAAASWHCVGMCGGFAISLGVEGERRLLRQVLYNVGRVNTLVLIGAVSGAMGAALVTSGPVQWSERALALIAGILMLVVGLESLGLGRHVTAASARWVRSSVGTALGGVMRSRSLAAPVAFGVFNAFLPCQLIYAFAARAASTASLLEGMLTMLAFGLGTIPAMLAIGTAGGRLGVVMQARLARASAVIVLLFAAVTLARGLGIDFHGGGEHHAHMH